MNVNVLTEGNFDGLLLAKLIAEEEGRDDVEIKVVGGKSSLYSVARTLLAVRRKPVAVVFDAHTPEPDAALERQREAEDVIGDVAGGVPFRVLVAVPELEVLFFQRPELLRRVFGEAINEHVMELAQLSPRRALQKLAPDKPYESIRIDVLRAMDPSDVQALRNESPLIQDLLSFITTTVGRSPRSAVSVV
jgi:hypothetical protein